MAKLPTDGRKIIAQNRRARHDYEIMDTYEAGLVLTGSEVKSLRDGAAQLVDGYAEVRGAEIFLVGINIAKYSAAAMMNHDPKRDRKLLLKSGEIKRISMKIREKGLTLVPLSLYFRNGLAKAEIALARGMRKYDKRERIEKRDRARSAE